MEEEIKSQVELIKDLSDEISSAGSQPAGEPEAESKQVEQEPVKAPKEKKPFSQWPVFGWFLNSKTAGALVGKSLLLLVIPYIYLFLLCWLFDSLRAYSWAGFILYSSIALLIINIVFIIWAVIRYRDSRRG